MSEAYAVPGVYVEESNARALSIQSGQTAVPVLIGHFNPVDGSAPLSTECVPVDSWLAFTKRFGASDTLTIDASTNRATGEPMLHLGSYSVRLYFENGGGPCYVLHLPGQEETHLTEMAAAIERCPDITLFVWCERTEKDATVYQKLGTLLGASATSGGNRGTFLLAEAQATDGQNTDFIVPQVTQPTQVATYFPALATAYVREMSDAGVTVTGLTDEQKKMVKPVVPAAKPDNPTLAAIKRAIAWWKGEAKRKEAKQAARKKAEALEPSTTKPELTESQKKAMTDEDVSSDASKSLNLETSQKKSSSLQSEADQSEDAAQKAGENAKNLQETYDACRAAVQKAIAGPVIVRASAAMAGVIARVDRERGVWKAPANVALAGVTELVSVPGSGDPQPIRLDDALNEKLVDKKINAIRTFRGQGVKVWGARTMAEPSETAWRYISVRRLFNAVERDARATLRTVVFEPNSAPTWEAVRSALDHYLFALWRKGALQGAAPEKAYFVQIGLGVTMTPDDVANGQMIAKVGMAAVRPAEFIVLQLTQDMVPS